jgi:hypothetical protein
VCFYGPVWYHSHNPEIRLSSCLYRLVIIACCAIYVFLGREILLKRRTLRRSLNEDSYILHQAANEQRNSSIAAGEAARSTHERRLSEEHKAQSANEPGPSLSHIEDAEYSQTPNRTTTEINMDAAAWSYLRCSFLFLVALVVTWV